MGIDFIEGLPCAGKSLIIKSLEKGGYNVVHELGRIIPPEEFPGNGASIEEILKIDDWFIKKEIERLKISSGIFDRSFFTHLAYSYAYGKHLGIKSFKKTIKKYNKHILNKNLNLPDNLIFVDVNPKESIKRQEAKVVAGRRPLNPFWRYKTFLSDLDFAYKNLIDCLEGVNIIILNGLDSSEEKIANIKKELKYQPSLDKKINLDKYMEICND